MEYLELYDKTDPKSIEEYAQGLIGKSFRDVLDADISSEVREEHSYGTAVVSEKKRNKGNLGQIIEESFFHYACNNDAKADFDEAGVELKVTPYKTNRNGAMVAKERLILTMIDYFRVVDEQFESSHFWLKSRLLLLVYYLYSKNIQENLDYRIGYVKLFTPPPQDLEIIKHDYESIVEKIKCGKAHELSEGDTMYLGAAPKGATSQDRRKQPFSSELAKPRAFAFKTGYMTYVLNQYLIPGAVTYEPIIKTNGISSFENHVKEKMNAYRGWSVEDLCVEFDIERKNAPKNLEALVAYRILGVKGNRAEEFEKANIVLKTIRVGNNRKIKESMSFPAFKFKELVCEEWDDSTFGNYLRETKFFFVIYQFDDENRLRLQGCKFWNIPYDDLEGEVKVVWERTIQVLKAGLVISNRNGILHNNFPKASENRVCHVRPHARNANDTYELPDGRFYPKQSFWLNNTYILTQIEDVLCDT